MKEDNNGMDDFLPDEEDYITVRKEVLSALDQEIEFERRFYSIIGGTDNFEVIPIPDEKGNLLPLEEKRLIETQANLYNIKILYRISHGNYATVFDPLTKKLGIMPENNSKGFAC